MSALIPWLVSQFGQGGGALVAIALILVGAAIARYAFWSLLTILMVWKLRRDRPIHKEGNR